MKPTNARARQHCWLTILALAGLARSAAAADYYVSATAGNDSNSGSSPSAPWRTLTHALATVPVTGASHTIHVTRGVHDAALGEVFPLLLPPGVRVVGNGSTTVIDGGGAAVTLVSILADTVTQMTPIGPETGLEGLRLENAAGAVSVGSDWHACSPRLADLGIRAMSGVGVSVSTGSPWGAGVAEPILERVSICACSIGVRVTEGTEFGDASATLSDCRIRGCTTEGVRVQSGGNGAAALLTRCRVEENPGSGLSGWCVNRGSAELYLADTLVAKNGGHGIDLLGQNAHGGAAVIQLVRSTVVDNGATGLRVEIASGAWGWGQLSSSILAGNADDIDDVGGAAALQVSHCNIGDGDFAGQSGCFSLPPEFGASQAGDYRLRFTSPCVDRGDPADAVSTFDLAGVPRPLDGDLDTQLAVDVGAHELAPLLQTGVAVPGGTIELELLGPTGRCARLLYSRSGLAAQATNTPFGSLGLPRPELRVVGSFAVAPWPPMRVSLPVPNVPGLAGSVVAYQALINSPPAPFGKALSNAVEVEVSPKR